ncbi:MAG: ABC transporter ATP-binding protein [Gammaproteobacteria bacterium]|nr:MAG: ABC transporter ATP-binding protein [Gammaproteobacteria bacterium]
MKESILAIQQLKVGISTRNGRFFPVDQVSFSIPRGQTFALLGESGCGKSMTALSIMRLLPTTAFYDSGDIRLGTEPLLALPEKKMRQVRGGRIGMIFQDPMTSLNPVLTVGYQIREAVALHSDLRGQDCRERVIQLLQDVGIPDPERRYDEYPHQLSGGMKQRVMIAMALAGDPDLLIADEPTTALDVTIQAQILDLLVKIQKEKGMSILLITHDLGVVYRVADQVGVMYAGQLVELATKTAFFKDPHHPYSRKLFASLPSARKRGHALKTIEGFVPSLDQVFQGCRFADRCDRVMDICHSQIPETHRSPSGIQVQCHLYDQNHKGKPSILKEEIEQHLTQRMVQHDHAGERLLLEVDNLKVYFPVRRGLLKRVTGQVRAVDGINLEIGKGRTLALVGESGCGKTTAGKSILKLLDQTEGCIRFNGVDLSHLSERRMRKHRSDLQIIFQDAYASMNPRMTIQKIIEEGMLSLKPEYDRKKREARVDELLNKVGLPSLMKDRYPHELSGGQRQRVCIARALAVEPKLIVCDEPTSALDVSVQAQILNLLKDLQQEFGLSYLFITHNLSVVEYLADEVAVMYLGRIVEFGDVESVMQSPRHPYSQALISAIPHIESNGREVIRLEGELPSPANPPKGCHFHPRCPHATDQCRQEYPDQTRFMRTHWARCFWVEQGQKEREEGELSH